MQPQEPEDSRDTASSHHLDWERLNEGMLSDVKDIARKIADQVKEVTGESGGPAAPEPGDDPA